MMQSITKNCNLQPPPLRQKREVGGEGLGAGTSLLTRVPVTQLPHSMYVNVGTREALPPSHHRALQSGGKQLAHTTTHVLPPGRPACHSVRASRAFLPEPSAQRHESILAIATGNGRAYRAYRAWPPREALQGVRIWESMGEHAARSRHTLGENMRSARAGPGPPEPGPAPRPGESGGACCEVESSQFVRAWESTRCARASGGLGARRARRLAESP